MLAVAVVVSVCVCVMCVWWWGVRGYHGYLKALRQCNNRGLHGAQPILLPLPGDGKHKALLAAIDFALELQLPPDQREHTKA